MNPEVSTPLMTCYRLAGQEFKFLQPVPGLQPFLVSTDQRTAEKAVPLVKPPDGMSEETMSFALPGDLVCQTTGWVGGGLRGVKVYTHEAGTRLEIDGAGGYFISRAGQTIGKENTLGELTRLDYEVLIGSAFTLALAMRGVWSLHASAAIYQGNLVVFLGESGQGKSTLAGYLNEAGWERVADDVLPVKNLPGGLAAFPRYPQLKLDEGSQPWRHLPEQLPIRSLCLLQPAASRIPPAITPLAAGETAMALLARTAGTRLFDAELLKQHLAFCTETAPRVAGFRLTYPHSIEALPAVKELLEGLC